MEIETGGPAFPFEEVHTDGTHYHSHPGLSLRDYFAAKAMQGMIAASENYRTDELCLLAYDVADAMLKERNK